MISRGVRECRATVSRNRRTRVIGARAILRSKSDVIFEDNVMKGEAVQFFYGGKEYLGLIIDRSDDEKKLKDIRQKIRTQNKQRSKKVPEMVLQQPIDGKRNRVQNKRYNTDYAVPPLMKRSGDNTQQSVAQKKWKKSSDRDTFTAINAKRTQLSALLDKDSMSANESSSSTSSKEYNEIISQIRKQNLKKKHYKKIENNSSNFETLHGSSTQECIKKISQANLSTIERDSIIENNSLKDFAPIRSITNVPSKISTKVTTSMENNFTNKSLQSDKACRTSVSKATQNFETSDDMIINDMIDMRYTSPRDQTPPRNDFETFDDMIINDMRYTSPRDQTPPTNVNKEEESDPLELTNILQVRQLDQLYGKDWPDDTMVMLREEIYCRKSVLCAALGASSKASHLVRRLLLGVFKQDAICRTTLTGRAPRAAGRN